VCLGWGSTIFKIRCAKFVSLLSFPLDFALVTGTGDFHLGLYNEMVSS
jgi:hypothetical protein